jgi:pilus assembly protein Flp/PilA
MSLVSRFVEDRSGATVIDYGLIVALIAVVILVAMNFIGGKLKGTFNEIANNLAS